MEFSSAGAVLIFPLTDEPPWGRRTVFVADLEGTLIETGSFSKG